MMMEHILTVPCVCFNFFWYNYFVNFAIFKGNLTVSNIQHWIKPFFKFMSENIEEANRLIPIHSTQDTWPPPDAAICFWRKYNTWAIHLIFISLKKEMQLTSGFMGVATKRNTIETGKWPILLTFLRRQIMKTKFIVYIFLPVDFLSAPRCFIAHYKGSKQTRLQNFRQRY